MSIECQSNVQCRLKHPDADVANGLAKLVHINRDPSRVNTLGVGHQSKTNAVSWQLLGGITCEQCTTPTDALQWHDSCKHRRAPAASCRCNPKARDAQMSSPLSSPYSSPSSHTSSPFSSMAPSSCAVLLESDCALPGIYQDVCHWCNPTNNGAYPTEQTHVPAPDPPAHTPINET